MNLTLSPRNREVLILATLLILGLVTRFFGIEFQSIWIDEGSTFYYSHYTWDQFMATDEPNSPLYYMMEGVFLDMLGQNEFGLRFTSAVAGALTIPLSYMLSMRLFKSRTAAIITAFLFLLSPVCLFYGQDARGYILVLMLFMIQVLILLKALETRKNIFWLLFVLVSVLQFGMHYSGIIGTFALYIYVFCVCCKEGISKDRYRLFIQMMVSGILFLLLASPIMSFAFGAGVQNPSQNRWSWCYIGIEFTINLLINFLFEIYFVFIFLILTIIGLYLCYRRQKDNAILLAVIIIVPVTVSTLLSFWMNTAPRYVLCATTGFYLIIPYFLTVIRPETLMTKKCIAAIAVVLIIMAAVFLPAYYTEVTKEDFRTGAKVLEENVKEGDLVLYAVGSPNSVYASFSFYYDPVKDGIDTYGLFSNEDLWQYTDTFAYDNIYVLILADYDPLDYLLNVGSPDCECICEAYRITVFKITGPLPH